VSRLKLALLTWRSQVRNRLWLCSCLTIIVCLLFSASTAADRAATDPLLE